MKELMDPLALEQELKLLEHTRHLLEDRIRFAQSQHSYANDSLVVNQWQDEEREALLLLDRLLTRMRKLEVTLSFRKRETTPSVEVDRSGGASAASTETTSPTAPNVVSTVRRTTSKSSR